MPIETQNPAPVQDLSELTDNVEAAAPLAQYRSTFSTHADAMLGLSPLASAFRFVEPGWHNYIKYVDMQARTGDEDARRYLAVWKALGAHERAGHTPEQLCAQTKVSCDELRRWVGSHFLAEGSMRAQTIMNSFQDLLLGRTLEFAMSAPEAHADRKLLFQASGLLPQTGMRGPLKHALNIFNVPVASSGSVALAGARSESSPVSASGLRGMDDEIVSLAQVMQHDAPPKLSRAERMDDVYEPGNDDDEDDDDDGPVDDDGDTSA
jgi:hypothetical protein